MLKYFYFIFFLILSSCYFKNNELPKTLQTSISKYKRTPKDSLTEIAIIPSFKYFTNLKKGQLIKDSFEIFNYGNLNDFHIDYLNNGINTLKIYPHKNIVKRNMKEKIVFEYEVNDDFIEKKNLFFFILVAGNSSKNISSYKIEGNIK